MAATKERATESVGSKWRAHTEEYLEGFQRTADAIRREAAAMPHGTLEQAEAIVEMAVTKVREHADEHRRSKHRG